MKLNNRLKYNRSQVKKVQYQYGRRNDTFDYVIEAPSLFVYVYRYWYKSSNLVIIKFKNGAIKRKISRLIN